MATDIGSLATGLDVHVVKLGIVPFLYGNNVVKAHLGRITDDTPEHTGVVVFSMTDSPLVSDTKVGCGHYLTSSLLLLGIRCHR
jgi:ribosome biogenesis protein Nip4